LHLAGMRPRVLLALAVLGTFALCAATLDR
jgi:hypothetical protein